MAFENLRGRSWSTLEPDPSHPLQPLAGKPVAEFLTRLLVGPSSRFGAAFFRLHLENDHREASDEPVMVGLLGRGSYPSQNWIEIAAVNWHVTFPGRSRHSTDPHRTIAGRQLWQLVGNCIPAGGHLMVEYESDGWRETALGLARGFPPVVTPLGHLLFRIDCGVNFKDWYFSEGLHEGPRKLQGWKALDESHRERRAEEMVEELRSFLTSPLPEAPLERSARRLAVAVLAKLEAHREE